MNRSVGVHDGSFHADEVTACALLIVFGCVDRDKVVRSRDSKELEKCEYVCDVGGIYDPLQKRFDHHQSDYTGPLSSAGMVLLHLQEMGILSASVYDFLNHALILGVDAHDNGRMHLEDGVCTFSQVISQFVPAQYDAPQDKQMERFEQALDFVIGHLTRSLERFEYTKSCKKKVEEAMKSQEKVLFFEEAMPWMESCFELGGKEHPALFVVMPSQGHWKIKGIPPSLEERMKVRLSFPASWAGLLDEQLQRVSKVQGAIFCHKGRFISVWKTKKDALQALEYVLNQKEV